MGEAGIFNEDDRVELIDGDLIDMAPIGPRHAYTVNLLNRFFTKQVSDEKLVCIQNPVQLGSYGEPEPDVAIVVNREYAKAEQHPQPQDVLLLIEVAETSLVMIAIGKYRFMRAMKFRRSGLSTWKVNEWKFTVNP